MDSVNGESSAKSSDESQGNRRQPGTNSISAIEEITTRTNHLNLSHTTNGTTDSGHPKLPTGLSPFAQEFVPRTFPTVTQPPPPVRPTASNYYPEARNGGWAAAAASGHEEYKDNDLELDDYFALNELKEFIDQVSSVPGLYETQIVSVTDVLNNCIDEDEDIVLQCIVNNIVDQAIIDQNFRYNGVRLCEHLIQHLNISTSKGNFKEVLLKRCKREHSRRDTLVKQSNGGNYLRGVTLFIADLSTRVDDKDLKEALPDLIETLLSHPNIDNIKSAVLVLKLCGENLESYYGSMGSAVFEKIMEKLKDICSRPESNTQMVDIITNVLETRERGWKAAPPPPGLYNPYAEGNCPPEAAGGFDDQNGYGPEAYGYGWDGYHPSYDFGPCGDEQDNDVVDAFEEFLRQSGQK